MFTEIPTANTETIAVGGSPLAGIGSFGRSETAANPTTPEPKTSEKIGRVVVFTEWSKPRPEDVIPNQYTLSEGLSRLISGAFWAGQHPVRRVVDPNAPFPEC